MKNLKLVLDASAFISGFLPEEDEYYTVYDVIKELEDERSKERFSYFLNSKKILIKEPNLESINKVTDILKKTGDKLSSTDTKLIALAIETGSTILSEDYGIQNVSSILGVKFNSIRESGIKKIIHWEYYCIGCKKIFSKNTTICDNCGNMVKRRPKRE